MIKQNVNIVNFNLLYEIFDEIKEYLSINIVKYENINDLSKQEKSDTKNSLIITNTNIDNLSKKNLLIFNDLPIPINKLVELININLIKIKFNYQSKIKIKNYEFNLNSKFLSKDKINLK